MKLLALDTSSLACTVGISYGGDVIVRHKEQAREHTRLLMPMIREVLEKAQLKLAELDGIVLGNGPGSFIGMRIAASVAQGLASGAGLSITPVSSLAAVALDAAAGKDATVAVAQDAHLQEVYLGLFRVSGSTVTPTSTERLQTCSSIVELDDAGDCIAAGSGWQRYPALLEANQSNISELSDAHYPNAGALLKLGAGAFDRGDRLAPEELVPAYLRQKVAEIPR